MWGSNSYLFLLKLVVHLLYPAPSNFNYFWNFGFFGFYCLLGQMFTGVFLAMHYSAHVEFAFLSVEHMMRDINYGWTMSSLHANGASLFFLVVYMHFLRSMYYTSHTYPRGKVWFVGMVILMLMMVTSFVGYVLPWGQMSFWAATVITNVISAVPSFGYNFVEWMWGSFSIDNVTLNSFFSFHYILPLVMVGLVGLHMIFLHEVGSNNPLGLGFSTDKISFVPYYILKDIYSFCLLMFFFVFFVFFFPNVLGHPDNYMMSSAVVTPAHMVPEWYFWPYYAILRSLSSKLSGVIFLAVSIVVFLCVPMFLIPFSRGKFSSPRTEVMFLIFVGNILHLGWLGGKTVEFPFFAVAQVSTVAYFLSTMLLIPTEFEVEVLLVKVMLIFRATTSGRCFTEGLDVNLFLYFFCENSLYFIFVNLYDDMVYQMNSTSAYMDSLSWDMSVTFFWFWFFGGVAGLAAVGPLLGEYVSTMDFSWYTEQKLREASESAVL